MEECKRLAGLGIIGARSSLKQDSECAYGQLAWRFHCKELQS